mmetsp:Transcript_12486/g.27126  ORF Transcript_12486/g.27126 Transcript_12486/m.27126 type:complete len:485 (+) Transcript_12486:97-1551(+)
MDATGNNVSAQRTEDSTDDVADGIIATPMVQVAPQGGMSAPTIRALTDDDPPIPVLHVVDREKETEAPHLHGGPPGPPCFPREFDDSLAQRGENKFKRNSLDHPRGSTSTVHSTLVASVASAAAMDPSMEGRVGEESVSSRGVAPPTSSHAADTAADLDLPSVGLPAFTAVGYRVAESDETPVYEGEISEPKAVLPFYQRTGFVFVMVAITLLAIGVVVGVLLSNNFDKNTGGRKAPTDGTLGQTAVNSLAPSSAPVTLFGFGDYLQIGDWRLARTCETCDVSHFSISSQAHGYTSQIFRDDGTYLQGPRTDYNGFDLTGGQGLAFSSHPIVFGFWAVQIRDWRIRQVDLNHLSVTNENDNVSRIYHSDGNVYGNVKELGGYVNEDLGEPTCAYLTSSFLQLGDWRFGEMGGHLSVTHKSGQTAMIYREDGTIHLGPRTDFNAWTLVDDEVLAGTKEGCDVGAPAAAAPSVSPPPMSTNGMRHA